MTRSLIVIAAACLLATACSDSGSDAGSGSTSTTAPPTTAPTISTPATSEPPPTTIDLDAQLAAAEQAYLDAFDAYLAAARDPSNPELRAEIERLYTGPNLEFTVDRLDDFVERNVVSKEADDPSRTIILLPPQTIPDRPDLVELVACEIDTEIIVEVGAAPDGSDALVTDSVAVRRGLIRMEFVDGRWKSRSGELLAELSSAEECTPE